jgi:hypothetical protein
VTRGWSDALNVQSINIRASPGEARNDLIVEFVC